MFSCNDSVVRCQDSHVVIREGRFPTLRCVTLSLCLTVGVIGFLSAAEPQPKVLIIGIDGLRPDALAAASTPHLDTLINEGAFSDKAQTGEVTKSAPGWASMLTGVWAHKHGIESNDFSLKWNLRRYPTLITRLTRLRPKAVTVSLAAWVGGNLFLSDDADFRVKNRSYKLTDDQVAGNAVRLLGEIDPELICLHFDGVDAAGHRFGFDPTQPKYLEAAERVDGLIGRVLDALRKRQNYAQEDWLILSVSDHGGQGKRHGPNTPECRTIFFLAHGRSVRQGPIVPAPRIVDVAATALVHLGIQPHPRWKLDGRPVALKPDRLKKAKLPDAVGDKVARSSRKNVDDHRPATVVKKGYTSDFSYRGPSADPRDGWTASTAKWSYAQGRDGIPGHIQPYGYEEKPVFVSTRINPYFTGDLVATHGSQRLRVTAYYWDTTSGNNTNNLMIRILAKTQSGKNVTRWQREIPGTIDLVYDREKSYDYAQVNFGLLNATWPDATALKSGWTFEDVAGTHISFSEALHHVDTFSLSTNGASADNADVGYYDDITIEPVESQNTQE